MNAPRARRTRARGPSSWQRLPRLAVLKVPPSVLSAFCTCTEGRGPQHGTPESGEASVSSSTFAGEPAKSLTSVAAKRLIFMDPSSERAAFEGTSPEEMPSAGSQRCSPRQPNPPQRSHACRNTDHFFFRPRFGIVQTCKVGPYDTLVVAANVAKHYHEGSQNNVYIDGIAK